MNVECPLCDHQKSIDQYSIKSGGNQYFVKICALCLHHYTWFDFEIKQDLLYTDDVYNVIDNRNSIYSKIMNFEYGKVLKYLSRKQLKGLRLLDFGSGKGVFLNLAYQADFVVAGVETAEARADFAQKKYGLHVYRSEYRNGKIGDGSYDVITLFHVLEHLPKPKILLQNLIDHNLKTDGNLVIEIPNLSSWQSKIAGRQWMHLDIPRHLSHFTNKRMKQFCNELNLEITREEYFSLHLGVLGMSESILSIFGYKGKIIKDLKQYNKKVMVALAMVLPLAFIVELSASFFNRGGIMRIYCRRNK
ncbi:MAG: class I SAM-dependent methyltransferase [Flavobacterium sp.]|nr:class I SAM-dependent methyltransferase [Pedobacter sp.]